MKVKTLLIAAATLAAGVISSQASVYSQNVVGYVNQTIPAGGFQIVGSQLLNGSDVNQTNGNINTTLINGFISSNDQSTPDDVPTESTNSALYFWGGSGYQTYYFFNQADATTWEGFSSPAGWYTAGGTLATINLNSGNASFIQNVATSPMTITTTGTVFQGTNVVAINNGYNLICLQEPICTNPATAFYGLPPNLTSANPAVYNPTFDVPDQNHNDAFYSWNGSGYATYWYFDAADATSWEGFSSPAGFYDGGGNPMPTSSYPTVNQGFFLYHSGGAIQWTNSFTAQ